MTGSLAQTAHAEGVLEFTKDLVCTHSTSLELHRHLKRKPQSCWVGHVCTCLIWVLCPADFQLLPYAEYIFCTGTWLRAFFGPENDVGAAVCKFLKPCTIASPLWTSMVTLNAPWISFLRGRRATLCHVELRPSWISDPQLNE